MTERICIKCIFWQLETNAIDGTETPNEKPIFLSGIRYGKCTASYFDRNKEYHGYDMGTLSVDPCTATDDLGRELFKEFTDS